VVRVEEKVAHACAPVVPGCYALECIVKGNGDAGVLEVAPAVVIELFDGVDVHVACSTEGLVEQLDGADGLVRSHVVADLVEHFLGVVDRVLGSPVRGTVLSRVVKAVLRFGSWGPLAQDLVVEGYLLLTTVQINHDLQAGTLSPVQRATQSLVRTLNIWVAVTGNHTPVTYWDSDVVQPSLRHLLEVTLSDPRIPMLLQL
jgi:hypothetical protein